MKTLWISLCVTLIIAFVDAQRNLNLAKPITSLDKRPHPPTWHRSPEERRKLSIFPRNNKKFVVTERPLVKKDEKAAATSTKRPVMRKLAVQDKIEKDTWPFAPRGPLMKPKRFTMPTASKMRRRENTKNFNNDDEIADESKIKTVILSNIMKEQQVNKVQINRGNLIQVLNNKTKINEQVDKVGENVSLSKQVKIVTQNKDSSIVNSPDEVFEEYEIDESNLDSSEAELTTTKVNKQADKATENVFSSTQVNDVFRNYDSLNVNSRDKVFKDYERYRSLFDDANVNETASKINKQEDKAAEKVFLSKKLDNVFENNDSLKVNSPDKISENYTIEETDNDNATKAEIENEEENENESTQSTKSTTLSNIEEPPNDMIEGRALDLNDAELNDQSENIFLILNNNQISNEKTADSLNLNDLERLIGIIANATINDTRDFSVHTSFLNSNDAEPLVLSIQNTIEETTENKPQELDDKATNIYVIKPASEMINEYNNFIPSNFVDAHRAEALKINEIGDVQNINKSDYINNVANAYEDSINSDIRNNLEILLEVIKSDSSVADNIEPSVGDLHVLNLDLNIVEDVMDKPDAINTELDKTTLESDLYYGFTESPIEIIFDNFEMVSSKEVSSKSYHNERINKINEEHSEVLQPSVKEDSNGLSEVNIMQDNVSENITNSTIKNNLKNLIDAIRDDLADTDNRKVFIGDSQLLNIDLNIIEEYTDNPDIFTTEVDGYNLELVLNNEFLTESPIEIIFDNLEPLYTEEMSHVPSLNESTNNITNKFVVTDQLTDEVFFTKIITDKSTNLTAENNSDEWLVDTSSHYLGKEVFNKHAIENSNNLSSEQVANISSMVGEEISNKTIIDKSSYEILIATESFGDTVTNEERSYQTTADKSKNLTENILKKSFIAIDNSSDIATKEEISDETKAGKTKKLTDKISNESVIALNKSSSVDNLSDNISNKPLIVIDNSNRVVTKEEMSNEIKADKLDNLNDEISDGSLIVTNSSNCVVTKEETSDEIITDKSSNLSDEILNESLIVIDNSSGVVTKEEMSDEMIADKSNNLTDEISNESLIVTENFSSIETKEEMSDETKANESNNLTAEISNESHVIIDNSSGFETDEMSYKTIPDNALNMAENISNEPLILIVNPSTVVAKKEMSDEMIADKSNNLTDEISNESLIVTDNSTGVVTMEEISDEMTADNSNNFTAEISNESLIVTDNSSGVVIVTNVEISDEMITDKSNNLTDEISNESLTVTVNFSSVVTKEQMSDEMIADKSNNLSNAISNESLIVTDNSSGVVTKEEISDEMIADKSNNFTVEISNESLIVTDNSSTTVTNEEMSHEAIADKSYNLTNEVSNESLIVVIDTSSSMLTGEEITDEFIDKSNNFSGDDLSNKPVIEIRHPSAVLASNEALVNRTKRSNNIIEEENVATTLSGYKYTGHETRLSHDLSFKNINA